MPQLQLPMFPEGVTQLGVHFAFPRKGEWVYDLHGMVTVQLRPSKLPKVTVLRVPDGRERSGPNQESTT